MTYKTVFRVGMVLFGLNSAAVFGQEIQPNSQTQRHSNLSIQPIVLPATQEENLPYIIEVAGSTDEEIVPAESASMEPDLDLRGKGNYEIFRLAGEAYERDDLEKAAAYYQALIDRGVRHGDVYYNLANTYVRMSDHFGLAILYYEKALELRPRDPDIQHNLDYARTFLIDEPPKAPLSALDTLLILHRQTTFNETFWILAALNFLLVAFLLVRTLNLKLSRSVYYGYLRGVVVVLFLLQVASAGAKVWEERNVRVGVILSDDVQAKAAPQAEETLIELNSGTKVGILDTRSGYAHIRLPDGVPAFIPRNEIGEI